MRQLTITLNSLNLCLVLTSTDCDDSEGFHDLAALLAQELSGSVEDAIKYLTKISYCARAKAFLLIALFTISELFAASTAFAEPQQFP